MTRPTADADEDGPEQPFAGGLGSEGQVVRVGHTVRRPVRRGTKSVHEFLRHLRANGLADEVPEPMGIDPRGREVLGFLPGVAMDDPYPDLVASERLLVEVAELQVRIHEAARSFTPSPDASWTDEPYFPASAAGDLVCHNDICVQNVVLRDEHVVGLIDFDYAHPVDPLFDIVVAARHWVPLRAPVHVPDARGELDAGERFRTFTEVHGLDAPARDAALGLLLDALPVWLANFQAQAEVGHTGFRQALSDGYADMNRSSALWLDVCRADLVG